MVRKSIQICILLISIAVLSASIKVDTNNTLFLDQYNRYTVFHGVNAIYKVFPFHPVLDKFDSNSSLSDMDL